MEQNQIDHKEDLTEEEIRRLKRQISDGNKQHKRLLDAYEKGAIELEELISHRKVIERRIESIQMKIDNLSVEIKKGLSFGNIKNNIDEVCSLLSKGLIAMSKSRKMKLCQELIEKVVVDRYNLAYIQVKDFP